MTDASTSTRRTLIVLVGCLLIGAGPATGLNGSQAQTLDRRIHPPLPGASQQETGPRFGRMLLGSTIGTSVGTGVGLVLLQTLAEMERRDDPYRRQTSAREDAEGVLLLAGATAILGGGPIGAVEFGRVDGQRSDAYVMSILGEILVGAATYGLVRKLSNERAVQFSCLGMGAAIGAASGAYLVTKRSGSNGLVNARSGRWDVSPPDVKLAPNPWTDGPPDVRISLLTVRL